MHPSVRAMWQAFVASLPDGSESPADPPSSWHFCDNKHDADECALLVRRRLKTATASSLWYFESMGESVPTAGDLHVVTNWVGEAQCVIRTTGIEVVPFEEVAEEHAAAEGEGDLTLEWWRRIHWAYYHRELEGTGHTPRPDMPIVCERFECVFPPA